MAQSKTDADPDSRSGDEGTKDIGQMNDKAYRWIKRRKYDLC